MNTPTKPAVLEHYRSVEREAKTTLADKSLTQLMDDLDASIKALATELKDHRKDFDEAIAKLVGSGL